MTVGDDRNEPVDPPEARTAPDHPEIGPDARTRSGADGAAADTDAPDHESTPTEGFAGGLAGTSILDSVMPVLLFVGLYRAAGLAWAIVGATGWSVKTAVNRRRRGLKIGWFVPVVVGALVVRGVIGIVTDSETVYVGTGIAGKFLIALALVGSVVIGRAAVAQVAPAVFPFPRSVQAHALYRSTMVHLTFGAAVYYVISGGIDIWIYNQSSIEGYMIIRLVVGWPFGMLAFALGFLYAGRRLNRIPGFVGMAHLLEDAAERKRGPRSGPR
jgi:hypothetical protein